MTNIAATDSTETVVMCAGGMKLVFTHLEGTYGGSFAEYAANSIGNMMGGILTMQQDISLTVANDAYLGGTSWIGGASPCKARPDVLRVTIRDSITMSVLALGF